MVTNLYRWGMRIAIISSNLSNPLLLFVMSEKYPFLSDENEATKNHPVYDVFPNQAKKRKPSIREVKRVRFVTKTTSKFLTFLWFKIRYCPLCFTRLCCCFSFHGSEASGCVGRLFSSAQCIMGSTGSFNFFAWLAWEQAALANFSFHSVYSQLTISVLAALVYSLFCFKVMFLKADMNNWLCPFCENEASLL